MFLDQANLVWEVAHAHWPLFSVFRYFAKNPQSGDVFGCAISSPEMLAHITAWADGEGWNSYWQPNPTRKKTGTRCSIQDITHWSFFTMDFDPRGDAELDLDHCIHLANSKLQGTPFGKEEIAKLVVASGRGFQFLYPLASVPFEFLSSSNFQRQHAAACSSYWTHKISPLFDGLPFALDTSCSDLPRPMRMPYTINQKTHQQALFREYHLLLTNPALVSVLFEDTRANYAPSQPTPSPTPLGAWQSYLPYLTRAGRVFITEGQEAPGRHKAAAAAMLSLFDAGCPLEQTLSALLYGAILSTPALPEGEMVEMVTRKYKSTLDRDFPAR